MSRGWQDDGSEEEESPIPGGARRAARNRTPTLRHRESSEQLEDEDGEEEMEEAQQPKRSKAAAKSKKPAKRSRKGLDDDDEDEEEDSDGEGRKGAQGKQQHVRTGMVNRVQSVQRPVQDVQDDDSEEEEERVSSKRRGSRKQVDSDSEEEEEFDVEEEEDEGPSRHRPPPRKAATGNGNASGSRAAQAPSSKAAAAGKAKTANGSSARPSAPAAAAAPARFMALNGAAARPPVKPHANVKQQAATPQPPASSSQRQQQQQAQTASGAGPSSQRPSTAGAGPSSNRQAQPGAAAAGAGPSSQHPRSGTQGRAPARGHISALVADKTQLRDYKKLVDQFAERESEIREEKAVMVQKVAMEDITDMAGRAIRLLLFKSHEKPKEIVGRKKINDAMFEDCRADMNLVKLGPVAFAMAQARLLSVFGIECKDVKEIATQESRYLLVNALPSAYRTRLVNKAEDDIPRVLKMLVLALITIGGGEMNAAEMWQNLAGLCMEQNIVHPVLTKTPWEVLNRMENIKYVTRVIEGPETVDQLYRIGECGKAEVPDAELKLFIAQIFKSYREKLAMGPSEADGVESDSAPIVVSD